MRITALVENISLRPDILSEHALSLYIESNQHKILFDMGASDAFAQNADTLGISLKDLDFAVLSHGHYDHGGGLLHFLTRNDTTPVYLSRYAFEPHFNRLGEDVGLAPELLERFPGRFSFVSDYLRLNDTMELLSCNDSDYHFQIDPFGLSCKRDGQLIPEDFRHEQYLLITEGNKRILVSGCSHKAVTNLVAWFQPDVLIGGFHFFKIPLSSSGKQRLSCAADYLNESKTRYITCHCTGAEQFEFLKNKMHHLTYLSSGLTMTL